MDRRLAARAADLQYQIKETQAEFSASFIAILDKSAQERDEDREVGYILAIHSMEGKFITMADNMQALMTQFQAAMGHLAANAQAAPAARLYTLNPWPQPTRKPRRHPVAYAQYLKSVGR